MTHGLRRVTLDRPATLRAALLTCSVALAAASTASTADAQDMRIFRAPGGDRTVVVRADDDRPMIGITTVAESERGDTLGLRIEAVTPGSPAEKAGLKPGDRLQSVNGLSLRADRADAGEDDYAGVLNRRLVRAVQATKPGEAVALRVLSGGSARDVRVIPVKASDLIEERVAGMRFPGMDPDRAVLGLSVGSTGSPRDTLGVFVQSVVRGGPAEQAGIVEGDRIAAINGVSLRVAREDAEDEAVGAARAERLSREVAKLKAGDPAELTVISAGRARTVRVTTGKARDLPEEEDRMPGIPEIEHLRRAIPFQLDVPAAPRLHLRTPGAPDDDVVVERVAPRIKIRTPDTKRRLEQSMPGARPLVIRRSIRTEV